jgi:hypothetical protein
MTKLTKIHSTSQILLSDVKEAFKADCMTIILQDKNWQEAAKQYAKDNPKDDVFDVAHQQDCIVMAALFDYDVNYEEAA